MHVIYFKDERQNDLEKRRYMRNHKKAFTMNNEKKAGVVKKAG